MRYCCVLWLFFLSGCGQSGALFLENQPGVDKDHQHDIYLISRQKNHDTH